MLEPVAYWYSHPTEVDPFPLGTQPLTDADKDAGWTETPLAPLAHMKAIRNAALDEAAAWLKAHEWSGASEEPYDDAAAAILALKEQPLAKLGDA